ncbi:MAG: DivIVA domain-containing protein [Arachnia propionica]|nr:DivIVA domain-containing protein [Arachnia propionica]
MRMSLTLEEVRRVRFRMARRGATGYEVGDVDTFIDKVEESFAQFENERDVLRREAEAARNASVAPGFDDRTIAVKDQEIESLRAEVERLRAEASSHTQTQVMAPLAPTDDGRVQQLSQDNQRLRSENDRLRRELDEARTAQVSQISGKAETLTVATREEATPAVVRLVSLATEQAEKLVEEANTEAQRKLDEAKRQASEITIDARTKAERVESEARVNAEQMTRDARDRAERVNGEADRRRAELFADLEREQAILTQKVAALRGFEATYRDNLRTYVGRHLEGLDRDLPEPLDVPELAERSRTPRLDALANQDLRA